MSEYHKNDQLHIEILIADREIKDSSLPDREHTTEEFWLSAAGKLSEINRYTDADFGHRNRKLVFYKFNISIIFSRDIEKYTINVACDETRNLLIWKIVSLSWAFPPKCYKIQRFKPNSTTLMTEYALNEYQRNIQIEMTATQYPILLRAMEASLPEGVTVTIDYYDPELNTKRYVPDTDLLNLKSELETMGKK